MAQGGTSWESLDEEQQADVARVTAELEAAAREGESAAVVLLGLISR